MELCCPGALESYRIGFQKRENVVNKITISKLYDASIRGWTNYFGNFCKTGMYPTLRYMNGRLVKWAMRKFKRFRRRSKQAENWLGRIAKKEPGLFSHWRLGVRPATG
jgi:RNA-directed DNA polymerase